MSHRRQLPNSPRSLSEGHQRSLCSDGAAGSGRDSSSQRKKRRHPVARVKGNWLPEEDARLRAYVVPRHPFNHTFAEAIPSCASIRVFTGPQMGGELLATVFQE